MGLLRNNALVTHPYLYRYPDNPDSWANFIHTLNDQVVTAYVGTAANGAIEVLSALPTLPDTDYPVGSVVFLETDDKLYRNTDGSTWSVAVDGNDIEADSILTNSIAAGQVTAAKLNVSQLSAISADMGNLTAGTITLNSGTSYIASGQTAYDTGTGFWLERNGGTPRFSIGNSAANKLAWDGSTLTIVGSLSGSFPAASLTGTVSLDSQISGTLSTAFAEAGLINGNVTINSDGTLTGAGAGQASLTALPGQVQVGSIAANAVTTGTIAALAVTAAKISVANLAAINADLGNITAGTIVLPSGGFIRSGQTAYDTGTGFYLGNDTAVPRFSIGNSAANKLTWDGTTLTIVGVVSGTVSASSLSGLVPLANENIAAQGWTTTTVFSATDADTVAWAAGTLTTAAGTAYSISGGNTGNMAARTYIYLNIAVSTTAFQTTTTASTAVGSGKILVAVAQNSSGSQSAFFQVFGGIGGQMLTSNELSANSVVTNTLAASSVTSGKISVSQLSAIAADMGTITAGTINLSTGTGVIRSGQTAYDTGTGWHLDYNSGTPRFSIGNSAGNKLTWNGTSLAITGAVNLTNSATTFTPTWGAGFAVDPSGDISYLDLGAIVIMYRTSALLNTSDDISMSFTGVPVAIRPSGDRLVQCMVGNAGGEYHGSATVHTSGAITFNIGTVTSVGATGDHLVLDAGGFLASGDKGLPAGWTIIYPK